MQDTYGSFACGMVNQRRLTNVGTFRAYALSYLKNHPRIHKGMTLMVRQLVPGAEGLPLEIYCFTNTTAWTGHEDIQADLFDHLLAVVSEFGLRRYQKPAGSDLAGLGFNRDREPWTAATRAVMRGAVRCRNKRSFSTDTLREFPFNGLANIGLPAKWVDVP